MNQRNEHKWIEKMFILNCLVNLKNVRNDFILLEMRSNLIFLKKTKIISALNQTLIACHEFMFCS